MTKKILFILLTVFVNGCTTTIPDPCVPSNRVIPTQTNVAENILGKEIMWRQQDFPILVIIDQEMRETRKQIVIDAINIWNTQVGMEVFFYEISALYSNEGTVCISEEDLGGPICGRQIYGWTMRYYGVNGLGVQKTLNRAIVKLHTGVPEENILGTVVHELGHTLGLNHDPNIESIMYPYSQRNRGGIEERDLEFVRRMILRRGTLPVAWYPQF